MLIFCLICNFGLINRARLLSVTCGYNSEMTKPDKSTSPVKVQVLVKEPSAQRQSAPGKKPKAKKSKKSSAGGGAQNVPLASFKGLPMTYIRSEKSAPGTLRVTGCESLGRISSKTSFTNLKSELVSPLNDTLCPRLSAIGLAFEQFSLNKFKLMYHPGCPATQSGNIFMYWDYDPADPADVADYQVLEEEVKTAGPAWTPMSISPNIKRVHQNRNTFFLKSNQNLTAGTSTSPAEVRQNNAGAVHVYASDSSAAATFLGYLYVEYDVTFHIMMPPRPISGAWSYSAGEVTVDDGNFAFLPFTSHESGLGLPGGETDDASSAWITAGGIAGFLDGCRQVYESGEWLFDLATSAEGASFSHQKKKRHPALKAPGWDSDDDLPHEDIQSATVVIEQNIPDEALMKTTAKARKGLPDAAGDFSVTMAAYDVTDGYIHPDFPVTVTGMTSAGVNQAVTFSPGVGAFNGSNRWKLQVPAGKVYVVRPYVSCGATAGSMRTFTDISLTANVISTSD